MTHNQNDIPVPMPVHYWPQWANYASISHAGELYFFSDKPKYNHRRKAHLVVSGKRVLWGYMEVTNEHSSEKWIWDRNNLKK